jgi:membrane-bound inhibitor of C-type lysozyme
VLNQVQAKFSDGSKFVLDDVVRNDKTLTSALLNETKTGGAGYSGPQMRFWEKGESATLFGKNAGSLAGQTVSTATHSGRLSRVQGAGGIIATAVKPPVK